MLAGTKSSTLAAVVDPHRTNLTARHASRQVSLAALHSHLTSAKSHTGVIARGAGALDDERRRFVARPHGARSAGRPCERAPFQYATWLAVEGEMCCTVSSAPLAPDVCCDLKDLRQLLDTHTNPPSALIC